VQPAIKVARYGFTVTADLVRYMDTVTPNGKFLTDNPTWAIDFAPHGYRVKLGETMTRKRYADTLEVISEEGADAFYTGAIANATISALRKSNGTMTLDDLKNYTVAIRKPAQITYRGYKLSSCSAPASGAVALSALKIVEGYSGFGDPAAINLTTHRLDEAIRFAYGERGNLGDPSFSANLTAYQAQMLSEQTAAEIRSKISDFTTQNVSWYDPGGIESLETPGTSHVVTADASGMAVSLTTTVNLLFGSQLMVPETGVIMNDEMVRSACSVPCSFPSVTASHPTPIRPSPAIQKASTNIVPVERLLHPGTLQRLRLHPKRCKLHQARKASAQQCLADHRGVERRQAVLRRGRSGRQPHHHVNDPEPAPRA
jgi:gamma-glutamyltranspeptidase/glutathione hydrolase